jgi:hypothetical protein
MVRVCVAPRALMWLRGSSCSVGRRLYCCRSPATYELCIIAFVANYELLLPWVMQRAWRGAPYLARSRSLSRSAQEFIYPRAAELSKSQSAAVGLRITKCFALLSYLQFICIRTKGIVFGHDERFTSIRKKHPFIHSCGRFRLILLHIALA